MKWSHGFILGIPDIYYIYLCHIRHIYWSPKTELKIYRIEMDGTGTAHVLYRQFFLQESSSSSAIFSLSLNFNISGDQLFSGVKYTGSDGYGCGLDVIVVGMV